MKRASTNRFSSLLKQKTHDIDPAFLECKGCGRVYKNTSGESEAQCNNCGSANFGRYCGHDKDLMKNAGLLFKAKVNWNYYLNKDIPFLTLKNKPPKTNPAIPDTSPDIPIPDGTATPPTPNPADPNATPAATEKAPGLIDKAKAVLGNRPQNMPTVQAPSGFRYIDPSKWKSIPDGEIILVHDKEMNGYYGARKTGSGTFVPGTQLLSSPKQAIHELLVKTGYIGQDGKPWTKDAIQGYEAGTLKVTASIKWANNLKKYANFHKDWEAGKSYYGTPYTKQEPEKTLIDPLNRPLHKIPEHRLPATPTPPIEIPNLHMTDSRKWEYWFKLLNAAMHSSKPPKEAVMSGVLMPISQALFITGSNAGLLDDDGNYIRRQVPTPEPTVPAQESVAEATPVEHKPDAPRVIQMRGIPNGAKALAALYNEYQSHLDYIAAHSDIGKFLVSGESGDAEPLLLDRRRVIKELNALSGQVHTLWSKARRDEDTQAKARADQAEALAQAQAKAQAAQVPAATLVAAPTTLTQAPAAPAVSNNAVQEDTLTSVPSSPLAGKLTEIAAKAKEESLQPTLDFGDASKPAASNKVEEADLTSVPSSGAVAPPMSTEEAAGQQRADKYYPEIQKLLAGNKDALGNVPILHHLQSIDPSINMGNVVRILDILEDDGRLRAIDRAGEGTYYTLPDAAPTEPATPEPPVAQGEGENAPTYTFDLGSKLAPDYAGKLEGVIKKLPEIFEKYGKFEIIGDDLETPISMDMEEGAKALLLMYLDLYEAEQPSTDSGEADNEPEQDNEADNTASDEANTLRSGTLVEGGDTVPSDAKAKRKKRGSSVPKAEDTTPVTEAKAEDTTPVPGMDKTKNILGI